MTMETPHFSEVPDFLACPTEILEPTDPTKSHHAVTTYDPLQMMNFR